MNFEEFAKTLAELKRPFESFQRRQASGGIVLFAATIIALILANSPFSDQYHHFWELKMSIGAGYWSFTQSLHHWINDGLMAFFFFVVGLELKREFLAGDLATPRKAALPVFALANAGIALSWEGLQSSFGQSITIGVMAGLFLGKPLGIFLFSWLAVRFNLADLPKESTWTALFGIGILGGIGFTMSIFISNLAFYRPELIEHAKVGIFGASILAGITGYLLLLRVGHANSRIETSGRSESRNSH